ncbi:FxsA family protein [Parvibaculum sp.]|uniref:FxsA family protein n=1 Tax=Parvibaculum sp. TaxID=2024848 RepID=UPI00272FA081|nr:FxsA family protein [Parvibaculum sp.]MDP1625981.1 FxsA family protein [Parvibaculum sp.]MDP2149686.1 FxsA family protein [Parvibaculum sp.]MDP3328903.1 FxsA family protein [Parvibaculum sp.]
MGIVLFLIFVAIPVIEIAIFIQVGGLIGVPATIAIVLGTALLGASLLRVQGLQTWRRAEEAMRRGEPPVAEMLDGVFLFVAALLMVTPGLFTDCIGVLLLIPPLRRAVGRAAAARLARNASFQFRASGMGVNMGSGSGPGRPPSGGPVIEGEAEEIGEDDAGRPDLPSGPRPNSPWRQ